MLTQVILQEDPCASIESTGRDESESEIGDVIVYERHVGRKDGCGTTHGDRSLTSVIDSTPDALTSFIAQDLGGSVVKLHQELAVHEQTPHVQACPDAGRLSWSNIKSLSGYDSTKSLKRGLEVLGPLRTGTSAVSTGVRFNSFGSSPLSSLPPSPVLSPMQTTSEEIIPFEQLRHEKLPQKKRRKNKLEAEGVHERILTIPSSGNGKAKAKTSYSGWSCRPAPPNIMSMIRFDHPPEMLKMPLPVLPDYPESSVRFPGSSRVRPDGLANRNDRPNQSRKSRPKDQAVKLEGNDEIRIVPLPTQLVVPDDGIPSSNFCKVLRLFAGLPKPLPRAKKELMGRPANRPPVWSESRQELCEALPYYRSFQSGLYMFGRVAFGYLLEAFPAPRDIWAHGGRVVISHGGGQCIRTFDSEGRQGPAALQADQSRSDARVDTLLCAYERRTPIVLIAGAGYGFLPWRLDCAYVVLGWYWISLTWVEAESAAMGVTPPEDRGYFHRYKIRFDWVDGQGTPWWHDAKCVAGRPGGFRSEKSPMTPLTPFEELPSTPLSLPPDGPTTGVADFPTKNAGNSDGRSSSGASISYRSNKRDISTLLNPTGLLTPPPSLPDREMTASDTSNLSGEAMESNSLPPSTNSASNRDLASPGPRLWPGDNVLCGEPPLSTFNRISNSFPNPGDCRWCNEPIIQIYQEGLICLRPTCSAFFMLATVHGFMPIPPGMSLTYVSSFLEPLDTPEEVRIPYDVVPPEPGRSVPETGEGEREMGGRTLWRGWVCRNCGRANCRYRWEIWECRNCGNTSSPLESRQFLSASDLQSASAAFLGDAKAHVSSGVVGSMRVFDEGTVMIYQLGSAGKVYHMSPRDRARADALLESYQIEAARGGWFQRRRLKANAVKGTLLAQHFAINSGASYKYIVDTMSFPFEESPKCVTDALDTLTQLVNEVLDGDQNPGQGRERVAFNEILSVMYREGQKMSWHDDGERNLGPTVSSLSLGSTATMSFRPKGGRLEFNKTYNSGSGLSHHPDGGVANREGGKGGDVSTSKMQRSGRPQNATPPTALTITLSHGDIMIMHGRDIQRYYDHRVIPHGFRVAATARVIGGVRVDDVPADFTVALTRASISPHTDLVPSVGTDMDILPRLTDQT